MSMFPVLNLASIMLLVIISIHLFINRHLELDAFMVGDVVLVVSYLDHVVIF